MSAVLESEYAARVLADAIDEIITVGQFDVESLPDTVVAECARRYLDMQIRVRSRSITRARERSEKFIERANETLRAKVRLVVDEVARDAMKAAWGASLLAESFRLPDGTSVTWGEATWHQHEAAARALENQAAGHLETAAIHRRAMADIVQAGVSALVEVA